MMPSGLKGQCPNENKQWDNTGGLTCWGREFILKTTGNSQGFEAKKKRFERSLS